MTAEQDYILVEIEKLRQNIIELDGAVGIVLKPSNSLLIFREGMAKALFEDFKAKLIEHYTAQIDELIKQLAC